MSKKIKARASKYSRMSKVLYSPEYTNWRHAVAKNDDRAISYADIAWRRRFRMERPKQAQ